MVRRINIEDFQRIVDHAFLIKKSKCKVGVRKGTYLGTSDHENCGSCPGNYYNGGECNYGGHHEIVSELAQINKNFEGFNVLVMRYSRLKGVKNENQFIEEKGNLISAFETMKDRCEDSKGFFYGSCLGIEGTQAGFNGFVKKSFLHYAKEIGSFIKKVKNTSYQEFAEFKMKIEKLEQMKAEASKLGEQIKNEEDPVEKARLTTVFNNLKGTMNNLKNEIKNHRCSSIFDENIGKFLNDILGNIIDGKRIECPKDIDKPTNPSGRKPTGDKNNKINKDPKTNDQNNNGKKGLFSFSQETKDKLKTTSLIVGCLAALAGAYFLVKNKLKNFD